MDVLQGPPLLEPSGVQLAERDFLIPPFNQRAPGGQAIMRRCPAQCNACSPDLRGQGSRANFPDRTSPLPQEAQTSCIMPLRPLSLWFPIGRLSISRVLVGLLDLLAGRANR